MRTVFSGIACVWLWAGLAHAHAPGPEVFCATYPSSPLCAAGPPPCAICHQSAPPVRNSYGMTIESVLLPGATRPLTDEQYAAALPSALAAVEGLDSDGDGASNGDEVLAGSLPGDAASRPGGPVCPPLGVNPTYSVCHFDARFAFRKIGLDFCGEPPAFDELEQLAALGLADQLARIDVLLGKCLKSEFWRGKNGQLYQLANRKVRPVGALKSGPEDTGFLGIADYYNDYNLFVWTQIDDHDARHVITADYWVRRDGPASYHKMDAAEETAAGLNEAVAPGYRAGLLTSRWTLLYTVMFAILPRGAAAQAFRAFLGMDIAKMEGLAPIANEPADYDQKGVTAPACAACHSTLDPMAYAFQNYNGFLAGGLARANFNDHRMTSFEALYPGISTMPSGYIFGQPVPDLIAWANQAANSDAFARATVLDYWRLLVSAGQDPRPEDLPGVATLATALKGGYGYSVERMLHDLVRTEAYGAP